LYKDFNFLSNVLGAMLSMLQRATENLVIEGKGDNNSLLSGIGEEILRILT